MVENNSLREEKPKTRDSISSMVTISMSQRDSIENNTKSL